MELGWGRLALDLASRRDRRHRHREIALCRSADCGIAMGHFMSVWLDRVAHLPLPCRLSAGNLGTGISSLERMGVRCFVELKALCLVGFSRLSETNIKDSEHLSEIKQGGKGRRTADTWGPNRGAVSEKHSDGHLRPAAATAHMEQHGTPLDGREEDRTQHPRQHQTRPAGPQGGQQRQHL